MLKKINFKLMETKEVQTEASYACISKDKKIIYTVSSDPTEEFGVRINIYTDFTKNKNETYSIGDYASGSLYMPNGFKEIKEV